MKQFWEERFGEKEYAYGTEPNDFLASIDFSNMSGKVLCIAEGQGRNAVYLAQKGFQTVAMDQSETGLKRATELATEKNVIIDTLCADLENFDMGENRWDGIISIFGHVPSDLRKKINKKIGESLKSGGFFLLEGYSKKQIENNTGGPKDLDMLYELQETELELGTPMIWNIKQEIERSVIEGPYHTGKASVIQLFGTKK